MADDGQFADLVFEGGGVKGIGLAGAFSALEQRGFTPKSVAGTSAVPAPLRRWATAGARAASAASSLRARRKARSSSNSPPESISAR